MLNPSRVMSRPWPAIMSNPVKPGMSIRHIITILLFLFFLTACALKPEGIGQPVAWQQLPGWQKDNHAQAWPALLQNCKRLKNKNPSWADICTAASILDDPDSQTTRAFFETWFVAHEVIGEKGKTDGLITGYYEPVLSGSIKPGKRFRYPIYGKPKGLLRVELGSLYPELKGKVVRGRLVGKRVLPFFDRGAIEDNRKLLKGSELVWVDDPIALFFLHIQGSGRIRLADGKTVAVGYADQNGHPYASIGRLLIQRMELEREDVSLQTIRHWLKTNPDKATRLLNENPSYIFFTLRKNSNHGPLGTLNVPLTAQRSIAVDRKFISLGSPVWLSTTLPNEAGTTIFFQRLVFAQDTGGAIRGAVRADVFWGQGSEAEYLAGHMKQQGQMFVLIPRTQLTRPQ